MSNLRSFNKSVGAVPLVPPTGDARLIQQGWLIALADLIRDHHEHDLARAMLDGRGLDLRHIRSSGLCPFVVRELERVFPRDLKSAFSSPAALK